MNKAFMGDLSTCLSLIVYNMKSIGPSVTDFESVESEVTKIAIVCFMVCSNAMVT